MPKHTKKHHMMKGNGIFQDIGRFAGEANKFLKDTKIISSVAKGVAAVAPLLGMPEVTPIAAGIGGVASSFGYGKRRKARGGCNSCLAAPYSKNTPYKMRGMGAMRGMGDSTAYGVVSNMNGRILV